jgi:hypothetical protein
VYTGRDRRREQAAWLGTRDNQYKVAACRRTSKPKVLVVLRFTS